MFSGGDDLHLVTADLCHEEQQTGLTVITLCVLPGNDVRIYCAVPDSSVTWINLEYGTEATSNFKRDVEFGPVNLHFIGLEGSGNICANSSATVDNIQKPVDGLNVTCSTSTSGQSSYLFEINVIGERMSLIKCVYFPVIATAIL